MSADNEAALTIEDLHYVHLPVFGTEKVYVPSNAKEMAVLEDSDLSYYLYIASDKVEEVNGNSTIVTHTPQVFEVRKSLIYRSVTVVPEKDLKLVDSEATAYFTLPKIPWNMVCEIDWFFREVYKRHQAESIVLLTYDEEVGGQDGWGFVVPTQENTSHDCNYKPESIAGLYPETASIVGSWHSHPMMTAYASGTDHKDQASFDGLHLTSGWLTANDDTEYYAEMQVGNMRWTFKPHILLDGAPKASASEDTQKLLERVSKKTYGSTNSSQSNWPKSGRTGSLAPAGTTPNRSNKLEPIIGLPKSAEDPSKMTYIGRLKSEDETECPFCHVPIISIDVAWRMCSACHSFIAKPGESLSDILDIRKKEGVMTWDIDIEDTPPKPIAMWERDENDDKITIVYEPEYAVKS